MSFFRLIRKASDWLSFDRSECTNQFWLLDQQKVSDCLVCARVRSRMDTGLLLGILKDLFGLLTTEDAPSDLCYIYQSF